MNTVLIAAQVSLCYASEPSDHSVSNHLLSSRRRSGVSRVGLTVPRVSWLLPSESQCVIWASPLTGGLTTTVGRIEFTYVTD
jgi:hypothetical protein